MTPYAYYFFTNIYAVSILTNFIGRKTVCAFTPSMILNSVFIGLYPYSNFGPTLWVDGFNTFWLILYFISQAILISTLHFQYYKGSWFFMPSSMRPKKFDAFLRKMRHNSPEVLNKESCQN
mmetsp:Transcript_18854/g.21068  ORF Transcript_18854/g.21068 Transcript_18854/m.21068 type:complete len:121 (-) Transcript_18854:232-594(-)